MGLNHSFLGSINHTLRDSSKGWAYIDKHMLSSSSLCKNKEVLARNGGGKFGKGMCLCICINGSKHHSWTWHPLFTILIRVWKSICLSFDLLQGHILGRLWVSAAKSLVVSFICSREVHTSPLLSRPYAVFHSYYVGLPCVRFNPYSYFVSPSKSITYFVSLMGDTSKPSCDESFSVDSNLLSENKT